MRIGGDVTKVSEIYGKNKNISKVNKTKATESKKDVVSISNQAMHFQTAMKAFKETPDIRSDKVTELEEKYNSGSYNVSDKDVASKMVDSFIDKID